MGILSLKAAIECDGCGTHFRVEVDTGCDIPDGWDLCDLVKDQVRGGAAEHVDRRKGGLSSVQADAMLCGECTGIVDQYVPDEREATTADLDAVLIGRRVSA